MQRFAHQYFIGLNRAGRGYRHFRSSSSEVKNQTGAQTRAIQTWTAETRIVLACDTGKIVMGRNPVRFNQSKAQRVGDLQVDAAAQNSTHAIAGRFVAGR